MTERSRPRLFAFPREVELGWLAESDLQSDARALLENMVDAFANIAKTRRITAATLSAIEAAARHENPIVGAAAATRLTVLSHYFPDAIPVIANILVDATIPAQLNLVSVLPNAPGEVATAQLASALEHADWRVRKAAAMASTAVPLPGMKHVLHRHREDRDARVRVWVELAIESQDKFNARLH